MSRIEELITKHCPEGVEHKELGSLGEFFGGLTGKSKEDFIDGNAKFITYLNVYNNPALQLNVEDKVKIHEGERQTILRYGDIIFTGSSETPDDCGMSSVVTQSIDEEIYLNSFCFFFRFNDPDIMLPDFAKHLFRSSELRYQINKAARGVTRFNVSKKLMENVIIPIPPIEVQRQIVRIVDTYMNLTEELTAKLTAELSRRKKQYEYYRNKLLTSNSSFVTLDSISKNCDNLRRPITASKREAGEYPYYGASGIVDYVNDYIFDGDYLLISEDGANLLARNTPIAFSISGKNWVNNHAHVLKFDTYETRRFVEIYLNSIDISPWIMGGAQPKLNQKNLNKILIPLPPEREQKRIVNILDSFGTLYRDILSGLPAEIELRKDQYKYYRDRLLTFKEKGA